MKLVIYDSDRNVVEAIENILSPTVDGNNIEWEGGSMTGVNLPFLLLDDMEISEDVTDEIIALNQSEKFKKVDLVKENVELKARLETAEMAIVSLMDFI